MEYITFNNLDIILTPLFWGRVYQMISYVVLFDYYWIIGGDFGIEDNYVLYPRQDSNLWPID